MRVMDLSIGELEAYISQLTIEQLIVLSDFIVSNSDEVILGNPRKKKDYISGVLSLLCRDEVISMINHTINKTRISSQLYFTLIWDKTRINTQQVQNDGLSLKEDNNTISYYDKEYKLFGIYHLITRRVSFSNDILFIDNDIKRLLQVITILPKDYNIEPLSKTPKTEFIYNNEEGVFKFISTIKHMKKSNLVAFGKTNEKPLGKTLSILKTTSGSKEFYNLPKLDTLATDLLTRSFTFYNEDFKEDELDTLKSFVDKELNNELYFFISRLFVSHLKKVRFDPYYTSEYEFFQIMKQIINILPTEDSFAIKNIVNFCKYRNIRFDLEKPYKTDGYWMNCDVFGVSGVRQELLSANDGNYEFLFMEPFIKGFFFYLGSLGLFELHYNKPESEYNISSKGSDYISVWDGLVSCKMTTLGKYIFEHTNKYERVKVIKKSLSVKFDEYKPIIIIEESDVLMMAKLEPYTSKYEDRKYILNYSKIFKDCNSYKALELKIDSFYKIFDSKLPKIFDEYFRDIKEKANLLQRDFRQIVISLKNDKKLMNLFMTNIKLQNMIIKAQGYKIIVLKENMTKLTKILKDNGFFIDF